MSLFLGPIHHWLYKKIKIQNDIIEDITDSLDLPFLKEEADIKYGKLEEERLEDIIDAENIHGWLQERVSLVERKLAYITLKAKEVNPNAIDKIKEVFYKKGKDIQISDKNSAEIAFKAIDDTILDGMPCDRAKGVIEKDENIVIFKRINCVHRKYWEELNIDVKYYYEFIDSFIEGLLSNTKFKIQKEEDIYTIK